MRIDNPAQLAQLRIRYATVEGALAVAQAAQATAQQAAMQYLDALSMLLGIKVNPGSRVGVNWDTGEVTIEAAEQASPNGVAV